MEANCRVSSTYGPSEPWIRAAGVVLSIPEFADEPGICDIAIGTSGDCNSNSIPDEGDITGLTSGDCNANDIPDECEPNLDCNTNGFQDICDIALGTSPDVDGNGIPDECCFASSPPQVP